MPLTTAETNTYEAVEAPETQAERIPISALPKLVWVGGGLLVANMVIGLGMWFTPNLATDLYGREVSAYESSVSKPSAFTPVVDTTRRKVRLAAKARPVEFVEQPVMTDAYMAAAMQGGGQSDTQLDMPRSTRSYQQLDLPVRTESALYRPNAQASSQPSFRVHDGATTLEMRRATYVSATTNDAAPRSGSDRDKKFVVIN